MAESARRGNGLAPAVPSGTRIMAGSRQRVDRPALGWFWLPAWLAIASAAPAGGREFSISGRVVDFETKEPIAGATVSATIRLFRAGDSDHDDRAPDHVATSDRDGRFAVALREDDEGEPRRVVVLAVRHPDFVARVSLPKPIAEVAANQAKGLAPFCAAVTLERGVEYEAEVVEPDEAPAAGVPFTIGFHSTENESPDFFNSAEGRTDAGGRIRARMPRQRQVSVFLDPERFAQFRHSFDASEREPTPTGFLAPDLGRIVLDPGVAVSGRVVGRDGRPVAGLGVLAVNEDVVDRRRATTDESGKFRFPPLLPGAYQVGAEGQLGTNEYSVTASSARPIRPVQIQVKRSGWRFPVVLEEAASATVEIRFVDSAGRPAPGRRVYVSGTVVPEDSRQAKPDRRSRGPTNSSSKGRPGSTGAAGLSPWGTGGSSSKCPGD